MTEHRDEPDRRARGNRREGGAPRDTEFLDLEISRVIEREAEALTRDAAREILKAYIRRRFEETLGDYLREVAERAADAAIEDFETNRKIESLITEHQERRRIRQQEASSTSFADDRKKRGKTKKGRGRSR